MLVCAPRTASLCKLLTELRFLTNVHELFASHNEKVTTPCQPLLGRCQLFQQLCSLSRGGLCSKPCVSRISTLWDSGGVSSVSSLSSILSGDLYWQLLCSLIVEVDSIRRTAMHTSEEVHSQLRSLQIPKSSSGPVNNARPDRVRCVVTQLSSTMICSSFRKLAICYSLSSKFVCQAYPRQLR